MIEFPGHGQIYFFKARAKWIGKTEFTDRITRMKLRQAFGRLIRKADDRGVFIMLDSGLPTRLTSAFPSEVEVQRISLKEDAILQVQKLSLAKNKNESQIGFLYLALTLHNF